MFVYATTKWSPMVLGRQLFVGQQDGKFANNKQEDSPSPGLLATLSPSVLFWEKGLGVRGCMRISKATATI